MTKLYYVFISSYLYLLLPSFHSLMSWKSHRSPISTFVLGARFLGYIQCYILPLHLDEYVMSMTGGRKNYWVTFAIEHCLYRYQYIFDISTPHPSPTHHSRVQPPNSFIGATELIPDLDVWGTDCLCRWVQISHPLLSPPVRQSRGSRVRPPAPRLRCHRADTRPEVLGLHSAADGGPHMGEREWSEGLVIFHVYRRLTLQFSRSATLVWRQGRCRHLIQVIPALVPWAVLVPWAEVTEWPGVGILQCSF